MPSRRRTKIDPEQFAPDEDAFEFEEPGVSQVGLTAEEAAEEEAELEAGQYGIPAMSETVAKRVLPPRLTEEQDADFLKDLEDATGEAEKDTFKGAGNYTYAKTADGDWFFTGPGGKTGVAKRGTRAFESIASEAAGKGSLWGREGYAGPTKAEGEGAAPEGQPWADAQVDPTGYYAEAEKEKEADEKPAEEKEAEEKEAKEVEPPKDIQGSFSLDNPPPAHSPAKMSRFLDENSPVSVEKLTAFITHANYPDRKAAAQMFLDTMNAKAEMASLAKRAGSFTESGNLSMAEKTRYTSLRQALGVPPTLSDRAVAAATAASGGAIAGSFFAGVGAVPGAIGAGIYGLVRPRDILKLSIGTPVGTVAKSPGAPVSASGEDIGALLEEQFKSE